MLRGLVPHGKRRSGALGIEGSREHRTPAKKEGEKKNWVRKKKDKNNNGKHVNTIESTKF